MGAAGGDDFCWCLLLEVAVLVRGMGDGDGLDR
jgi:hypothetical protein